MAPRSENEDDLFFPERGRSDLKRKAISICESCPVTVECDDYRGRTESMYGIWGGKLARRSAQQPKATG